MNIGVFLPNWIGDAVMATATLRALHRHYGPSAALYGIARPYIAGVLDGTPWLNDILFHAPRAADGGLSAWQLVRRLRALRLDVAVLLTNSFRTALLAFLGGARQRVGYAGNCRDWLLTDSLPLPAGNGRPLLIPTVDQYLALAARLGCRELSPRLELATRLEDQRAADLVLRQARLRSARLVTLNSSGAYGQAKLWPREHCAALARRIAEELDHDVLVLCGPREREAAADIARQARHPGVASLADAPLSVGLSKACIRRSRLLVTTDSGPRHMAVAFGVDVITLFGPTPPTHGLNPTARETALALDLDCMPCGQRRCALKHHRCLRELSVDRVFAAVREKICRPQRNPIAA